MHAAGQRARWRWTRARTACDKRRMKITPRPAHRHAAPAQPARNREAGVGAPRRKTTLPSKPA